MKPIKLKTKIILLSVLPMLVMSIVLTYLSVRNSSQLGNENAKEFASKIYNLRQEELRNYTQLALSAVDHVYKDASPNDVGRQELAKQIFRNLRYGDDGYFFVYDYEGQNITHPIKPHLEGKNLWDLKDVNGTYVIRELIREAKNEEGGYTKYVWDKPSVGKETDKLGFSTHLYTWRWMIGTGLYMDDVSDSIDVVQKQVVENSENATLLTIAIASIFTLIVSIVAIRFTVSQGKLANDKLQKLSRASLVEREKERSEVTSILNSEILNGIGFVREKLKTIAQGGQEEDDQVKKELATALMGLNKIHKVVSGLSNKLRPEILIESGVYVATEALVNKLADDSGINFSVATINAADRLNLNVETVLYRIIEEAVMNIVLHSKARNASVRLRRSRSALTVTIQDDGVGFDPYEVTNSVNNRGVGLSNMQLQMELLNGVFTLFSSKGTGTIIKLAIPTKQN